MSGMNGNPHYEDYQLDLDNAGEYDGGIMQLHATLALAYEQRTANLIAKLALALNTQVVTGGVHLNSTAQSIDDEIMARLGLNDEVTA